MRHLLLLMKLFLLFSSGTPLLLFLLRQLSFLGVFSFPALQSGVIFNVYWGQCCLDGYSGYRGGIKSFCLFFVIGHCVVYVLKLSDLKGNLSVLALSVNGLIVMLITHLVIWCISFVFCMRYPLVSLKGVEVVKVSLQKIGLTTWGPLYNLSCYLCESSIFEIIPPS